MMRHIRRHFTDYSHFLANRNMYVEKEYLKNWVFHYLKNYVQTKKPPLNSPGYNEAIEKNNASINMHCTNLHDGTSYTLAPTTICPYNNSKDYFYCCSIASHFPFKSKKPKGGSLANTGFQSQSMIFHW